MIPSFYRFLYGVDGAENKRLYYYWQLQDFFGKNACVVKRPLNLSMLCFFFAKSSGF